MAPVEPWERVWIDAELFEQDIHSYINCTICHGGQNVDDMEAAHEDIKESVVDSPEVCGRCHVDVGLPAWNSLHNTLRGYDDVLYERSIPEYHATIEEMESYHCNDCHATCGDCHVSQPSSVGGGLVEGHVFNRTPSMARNCTACHGSRIKDEYYGAHEGIPSDVHFRARMSCTDCHSGDQMHGMGAAGEANHRYDGPPDPTCQSCHDDIVMGAESEIEEHMIHDENNMSCQVCHSTQYTNCVGCHVARTETDVPFYTVEDHFLGFYIGRNPERSEDRPWEYVPLRRVPIAPDVFSFYGEDLMPNFNDRPTWAYATPHNIQRITPQAESCYNCHENDDIFLTRERLARTDRLPNRDVIVDRAPGMTDWRDEREEREE